MNLWEVLFADWPALGRTAVLAIGGYVAAVVFIRLSGKRSLAKMNAFDLVVTVALGSMLASMILSRDTALSQGMLGIGLLLGLQYILSWFGSRDPRVGRMVNGEPRMLFYDGDFLPEALRGERVTEDEVLAAVRGEGVSDLSDVWAVVLETDASLSVIRAPKGRDRSSLRDVAKRPGGG